MHLPWQKRALGNLTDFDPGFGDIDGTAVPMGDPSLIPDRFEPQSFEVTLPAMDSPVVFNVEPPELEEKAETEPVKPAPSTTMLAVIAGVGVVVVVGLSWAIIASNKPKKKRRKNPKWGRGDWITYTDDGVARRVQFMSQSKTGTLIQHPTDKAMRRYDPSRSGHSSRLERIPPSVAARSLRNPKGPRITGMSRRVMSIARNAHPDPTNYNLPEERRAVVRLDKAGLMKITSRGKYAGMTELHAKLTPKGQAALTSANPARTKKKKITRVAWAPSAVPKKKNPCNGGS